MASKKSKKKPKFQTFQDTILNLQKYWSKHGCIILQPYDMEVGAGTFHPATTLRSLGPKPWKAAYVRFLKIHGTIVDQTKRKQIIQKEFTKILSKKKLFILENLKLFDEVVDLVECPNVLLCDFDKKFLSIPKEILILTMQSHQKYFPTIDKNNQITNQFLLVANKKDQKGLIKLGNQRVVDARLSDAEFFWNKDKTQNLVKKVSELKRINFFKGLGTYFDKVQPAIC